MIGIRPEAWADKYGQGPMLHPPSIHFFSKSYTSLLMQTTLSVSALSDKALEDILVPVWTLGVCDIQCSSVQNFM